MNKRQRKKAERKAVETMVARITKEFRTCAMHMVVANPWRRVVISDPRYGILDVHSHEAYLYRGQYE